MKNSTLFIFFGLFTLPLQPMEQKSSDQSEALAREMANCKVPKFKKKIEALSSAQPFPKHLGRFSNPDILKCCTQDYYIPLLRALLEQKKLDPNTSWGDDRVCRLLPTALAYGAQKNARLLLDYCADTNLPGSYHNSDPQTPIYLLIDQENIQMLELILKYGADANKKSEDFRPESRPLIQAIVGYDPSDGQDEKEKGLKIIKLLLAAGADPYLEDNYDVYMYGFGEFFKVKTPFNLAQKCGYTEIESLFQERAHNGKSIDEKK